MRTVSVILISCLLLSTTCDAQLVGSDERSTLDDICDTAGTDIGYERCRCIQRDQVFDSLHVAYNAVLLVLNKERARLNARSSLDSSALADVEDLWDTVTGSQEAWVAYQKKSSILHDMLEPRHTGSGCATAVAYIKARTIKLEDLLALLRDRY